MHNPAILFVKPGAVRPNDKGKLFKAGVVVVEVEDPQAVKLVRARTEAQELDGGMMLLAASRAIVKGGSTETSKAFTAAIAAEIEARFGKR